MNNILFSIVIPTYNRAKFIEKTINSVLDQTYKNFEVIVVDDGSTDNTQEVVKSIKDNRIVYFKKQNEERGAARNYGTKKSKGDYINFFDSDDLALNNHLFVANELIKEKNNPEAFHLAYNIITLDGHLIQNKNNFKGNLNKAILIGNIFSCNGVFLRSDIADKFPFSEIRELSASEDWLLWLKLSAHFKFHYSNIITSSIINHDFRSVMQFNEKSLKNRTRYLIEALKNDEVFRKKRGKYINAIHAHMLSYTSLHAVLASEKKIAIKYLVKAIKRSYRTIFSKRFFAILKHLIT